MTIAAVLLYEKERGDYPNTIQELVDGGYLAAVSMDPFSDKPLVYKKTDVGFVLYSVGKNFTDDGGQPGRVKFFPGRGKSGRLILWHDEGDTVFWPREEN